MQIGAMNHPARNPLDEIEWIARHHFDFVDFTFEPPAADPDGMDLKAVRSALERAGLGVVAHTAYFLPLASPYASVREAALSEFRRNLQAACGLGASVMNVHYHRLPTFFTAEQTVQWHVQTLKPLCDEAAEAGVTIVLEHIPHAGANQLENIAQILEQVPLLRFHLDAGHTKLEGSQDRWKEYLHLLGSKLLHVHLSDNDGTADQHLPLGAPARGCSDWPQRIRQLKATGYDGTITLEVFSPLHEYLLMSRDLLRTWWQAA